MKKNLTLITLLFTIIVQAQVGIGNVEPKATLDILGQANATNAIDGVLIPRLTGEQLREKNAVYTHLQHSALVYITEADSNPMGKTLQVTSPGFYYYHQPEENSTGNWLNISQDSHWKIQNTSNSATSNADNIYQNGKVAIGFDQSTSISEYNLEVKGPSKFSNFEDYTGGQGNNSTPRLFYGTISGGNTTKHANNTFSKGNMFFVSDIDFTQNTDIGTMFNNTSIIKNEFLKSGSIESISGGVFTAKKLNDNQMITGTQSSILTDVNEGLITNLNQNQFADFSNNISQIININNLTNHSNYTYGINLSSVKGADDANSTNTLASIHLFHNNGITFMNKEPGISAKSYTFPRDNGSNGQVLTTNGGTANATLSWKNISDIVTSTSPKFFYMPSISLPLNATNTNYVTYAASNQTYTVDLYAAFKAQFDTPIKSSNGSATGLQGFVLPRDAYEYYIIYADNTVFPHTDINFSTEAGQEGKFTYKVNPATIVNGAAFMNIVLKVK